MLKPDLNEETTSSIINKYQKFLYLNSCKNICVYDRGRRHLSYPIKKYHDGIYIQINYTASHQIVINLEKSFKFDDNIIRYLTTSIEKAPSILVE
uniref:ribosomal protein S6 n=1 Tax=Rhodaphanes brevistipitata TaxID=446136 RepID=UPI001FCD957E|nr:ribosomal protein S6 [Rhodaphanes brevistipitata]UNJ18498.1 ribosomal protein S6 [Rhodaphanes brevistipitata]